MWKRTLLLKGHLMKNLTKKIYLLIVLLGLSSTLGYAEDTKKESVTKLTLAGTDQMQFDQKELKVRAGSMVELTFKHSGQLPVTVMGHNFVLLKQGVNLAKFAIAAMQGKNSGYILPKQESEVIARTKLIGGGESTTITFKAPPSGVYEYLCTFPGHYAMMKGKMIVE